MRRVCCSILIAATIFSLGAVPLRADTFDVSDGQKKFYKAIASSWVSRNDGGISRYFDGRVYLDLGPHCRAGKYKKAQAIGVLKSHLNRHIAPDRNKTKILRMTDGYMVLRHHYKDLPTGQRKQQNLWFYVRKSGQSFILTEIKR